MSKLFFDHLVDLSGVEREIKKAIPDKDAQDEMIQIIDEIAHHRVVGCILDRLPKSSHKEFINHVADRPHDQSIFEYLKNQIGEDITDFVKKEVALLGSELLSMVSEETKKTSAKK